jgi:hypothetical protein
VDAGDKVTPPEGVRYQCPCWGYPTLEERGGYEICELCNWEDDGQDDPHADEVWGGPNQDYSPTEARQNFKKYPIQYDPARKGSRSNSPAVDEAKRNLMAAFDRLAAATDTTTQQRAWHRVYDAEATLLAAEYNR